MKKALSLFLAILMAFSLVACTQKKNSNSTSEIEVSEGLLEVSITLPADFVAMSEMTEEEYIADVLTVEGVISASFNADGSVTLIMTKPSHNEMLAEMMLTIDERAAEFVASEILSFSEITHNNDLTEFNFVVNRIQYESGVDSVMIWSFGLSSSSYHIMVGNPYASITMNIIDETTNEVFKTLMYPDDF